MKRLVELYDGLEKDRHLYSKLVYGKKSKGKEFSKIIERMDYLFETNTEPLGDEYTEIKKIKNKIENIIAEANIGIIVNIAKKIRKGEFGDRIGYGYSGIVRAAELFDLDEGFRFSTFAAYQIRAAIEKGILIAKSTIRIPQNIDYVIGKISKTNRNFYALKGGYPNEEELEKILGIENRKICNALKKPEIIHGYNIEQIEMKTETSINEKNDPIMNEVVMEALDLLETKERSIMEMRLGINGPIKTFRQIGVILNISRERARQIQNQSINLLRLAVLKNSPEFADALNVLDEKEKEFVRLRFGIGCKLHNRISIRLIMKVPQSTRNDSKSLIKIEESAVQKLIDFLDNP